MYTVLPPHLFFLNMIKFQQVIGYGFYMKSMQVVSLCDSSFELFVISKMPQKILLHIELVNFS